MTSRRDGAGMYSLVMVTRSDRFRMGRCESQLSRAVRVNTSAVKGLARARSAPALSGKQGAERCARYFRHVGLETVRA